MDGLPWVTGHVAGPLVALEVEVPPGLGNVLRGLLLLHLPQLLLCIFTQEVDTCGQEVGSQEVMLHHGSQL